MTSTARCAARSPSRSLHGLPQGGTVITVESRGTSSFSAASPYITRREVNPQLRLPLEGNLDLTYRCNNRCLRCWLWMPANGAGQAQELTFVAAVHKNQVVFLEDPCRSGGEPTGIRVDEWMQERLAKAWKRVEVRGTTKGLLAVEVLHQAVWVWDGHEKEARKWRLLVRREVACPTKIAYVLSNAGPDVTVRRLAFMQAQRYWVERVFEDAKTEAGLGEYRVRGWRPWQRHMALVAMAMAFLLQERLDNAFDSSPELPGRNERPQAGVTRTPNDTRGDRSPDGTPTPMSPASHRLRLRPSAALESVRRFVTK
jgi:hypothetical protein